MRFRGLTLLILALAPLGCAVHRTALSSKQLEEARFKFLQTASQEWAEGTDAMVRRMRQERDEFIAGTIPVAPTFDALILSGGGDYGAFGAGFLEGWGNVEGTNGRPHFDIVTGVSTGALIAPFAFTGSPDAYDRCSRLYQDPKKDWAQLRDIFFFLPGRTSFLETKGLRRDLAREVNAEIVAKIAAQARQGRLLGIGTTNLDMGMTRGWDLGKEAILADETGDLTRIHDILLASAAIPAAFPPQVIDGTLYVDGGTTENILYSSNMRSEDGAIRTWQRRYPNEPIPKMRLWVIVNNQLGAAPRVVQPTWISITEQSLSTAIRAATKNSLRVLALQCELLNKEGVEVEFRFVSIPDSWTPPAEGVFNKQTMTSLAELGKKLGADPGTWKTELRSERLNTRKSESP